MKKNLWNIILVLTCCLLAGGVAAQTYPVTESKTVTVTTTGTGTWNAPVGAWKITKLEAWGGGGGGGNATSSAAKHGGGSGGGGGAYAAYTDLITLSSIRSLSYAVGEGGTSGNDGGASVASFNGSVKVEAGGGKAGKNQTGKGSIGGGGGGVATLGIIKHNGGTGGTATLTNPNMVGIGGSVISGGGGGAAGSNGIGGNANANTAGVGTADGGGNGADGYPSTTNTASGRDGNLYGGGGSGAVRNCWSIGTESGGKGAQGAIRITYETLTLQVTRNLNYDGAPTKNFTILYYANYTNENLAAPTREGYVFLGWSLSQHGNDFVSTSDKCQNTGNYTIYAQWLNVGEIAGGSTTISQNDSYTINSVTEASTTLSTGISYSWKCSTNGGAAAIVAGATSPSLTQQYNTQGTFAFTRYVTVNGQTYPSNGQMNITVAPPFDAGAIVDGNVSIIPGGEVSVSNASVGAGSVWRWKVNGEVIDGESGSTLSNYQLCTPNVYNFIRETKSPAGDWRASSGMYVATVSAINPGAINTEVLDVTMSESAQIQNESAASIVGGTISSYEWTYTYNGGSETVIDGQTTANLELVPGSLKGAGQYVFKRYAKIDSPCEEMSVKRVAAPSKTVNVLVTVNLHANGGTVATSSFTAKYNEAYGSNIDNIVATHPSYSFLGWYTDAEMGENKTSSSICTSTSDETLYAHWGHVTPEMKDCDESESWTLPLGTWKLTYIQAWGGGGGGGNALAEATRHGAGSGGGGGAYSGNTNDFFVVPGEVVSITVGKGGAPENDGETSTVTKDNMTYVSAAGGKKGVNQTGTGTAAGGQGGVAGIFGDVNFAGGQGGTASVENSDYLGAGGNATSGGGGGAAGTTGKGNDANGNIAGAAKTMNGGAGGAGDVFNGGFMDFSYSNGNAGSVYGGGASGAYNSCWNETVRPSVQGSAGADGHVTIAYELLTITVKLNPNGGDNLDPDSIDVVFYDKYGTLPIPTRDGYAFIGWYTAAENGNRVTENDVCTYSSNKILYAHWLNAGEIYNGNTILTTPCQDYVVENVMEASTNGDEFSYFWKYSYNNEEEKILNVNKSALSQEDCALDSVGTYVFSRYAKTTNPEVVQKSLGSDTVIVKYLPGTIASKDTVVDYAQTELLIAGSEITNGLYRWRCNDSLIVGADEQNYVVHVEDLCPDSNFIFTREVKVNGCVGTDWKLSANTYRVTVETNSGEIAAKDTTVKHDHIAIVIEGNEVLNAEYRWYCNSEMIDGATGKDYTIPAESLCPDSIYSYIREVKIACGNALWKLSANTYQVTVETNPGEITAKDTTVKHDHIAIVIEGNEVLNAEYRWYCNSEMIDGATGKDYTIPAESLCPDSIYAYTREVKITCGKMWVLSANTYRVTVETNSGEITAKDTNVKHDHIAIMIEGNEVLNAEYRWYCNSEMIDGATSKDYTIPAESLCPDSIYAYTREVKITCGKMWVLSANTYQVTVETNSGEITAKDTTVKHDHIAIMIEGNEVLNAAEYRWYCNNEMIDGATGKDYTIPAESLCPDSIYAYTREVKITCGKMWVLSANTYRVTVETNSGEITAKDTTVKHDHIAIMIEGNEVLNAAEYRWYCNNEMIDGATGKDYTIPAESLCPDSIYAYTREVKIACGNAQWKLSANTYRVTVETNSGEITAKDTTVQHDHIAIMIEGNEVLNAAEYRWYCNNEMIDGATGKDYTIPAESLCPNNTYSYTREVKVTCENTEWKLSANAYKVTVAVNNGEIEPKDTAISMNETLVINGSAISKVTYRWKRDGEVIDNAHLSNFTVTTPDLCPGSEYVFTREVSVNNCPLDWTPSDNTYKVTIEKGYIAQNTTIIEPGKSVHIEGDNLSSVEYKWFKNDVEIPDASTYSYDVPTDELCTPGTYIYTRKIKGIACDSWVKSDNQYTVEVVVETGKINEDAIYICNGSLAGVVLRNDVDAQGTNVVYSWSYTKDGVNGVYPIDINKNELDDNDLASAGVTAAGEQTYRFTRYAKINCADPISSEGIAILYITSTENDTLDHPDMYYQYNYGDDFFRKDSLKIPDLMHNGAARPQDWVETVILPAEDRIYPDADMTKTIHWKIVDKCGNTHECDQTLHFELPACGGDFTATDYDGNTYNSVRIGLECWLTENLKSTHYSDGEPIPNARAYEAIEHYADTVQNANIFGRLYSWYAVVRKPEPSNAMPLLLMSSAPAAVQGVCPEGWCVPTEDQFNTLLSVDAKKLRTAEYWLTNEGTNETGFSMLPAGMYNKVKSRCEDLLGNAYFWTSDENDETIAKSYMADCHCYMLIEILTTKSAGYSVRCVKGN